MELTKIVLPGTFSVENWGDYFEMASKVFTEQKTQLSRYNDDDFTDINTLGALDFEDASTCKIYLVQVKRALSERASRRKQFDKATEIIKQENTQAGLFVFYDSANCFRLSLVYPIYKGIKRSFSNFKRHSFYVSDSLPNKTYQLQLGKYELNSMAELKDAFSVDKVSDVFYQEFEKEYHNLQAGISHLYQREVTEDQKSNFALLFVLRIIFLGFVQKKGWLGDNPNFIKDFIKSYDPSQHPQGMYQDLLCPLFFTALNSAPSAKNKYGFPNISEPFKSQLVSAPYLNGGLFRKHQDYDTDALIISNEAIEHFTGFLFSYNFTLEENTLYDEELELNPEFLGIIFEKLINKANGAIYTPRLEVDFMCRISLVKYLQRNCPTISLENIYKLFFPEYGEGQEQSASEFPKEEAQDVLEKLETVSVCDPAIGSGAFAVGMLNVIDEIECSIYKYFLPEIPISSPYERKKRIIFQSLYGVEVKQWAVWITQLRLWITLLIEAEDGFKNSDEPLLPSFDFKIRQGDSLVQMLSDSLFPISGAGIIAADTERKVNELIALKKEYYYNKCPHKLHDIELSHRNLYIGILEKKKKDFFSRIYRITGEAKKEVQSNLFDTDVQTEIDFASKKQKDEIEELKKQIDRIDHEISQVMKHHLPFIWRIDFPEIFMQKDGFDIMIGNPPYVSQEEIEDPLGKITENKKYKELLRLMVNQDFPRDISENAIDGKSDLYTFFYIRGLKLLNKNGILTYICSNSWLDTRYGAWLQEFLVKKCPIHFIIDNQAKRSFKSADINSIITTFGAYSNQLSDNHLAKFIVFKLPFEESLFIENLLLIEDTKEIINYADIKVNPISHKQLWDDGQEKVANEEKETVKVRKYIGYKWGGYYLRAPKVYFDIIAKAQAKLEPLKNHAKVSFGLKTGANDFFYLTKTQIDCLGIEEEYIKPIIRT